MHKWTEEEKRWLKEYIPGHSEHEIRAAFLERFGLTLTEGQIGNMKTKLGVKSGTHGGQFRKGQTSWNKGKKLGIRGRMAETTFKPGRMPHNHHPVGTEVIDNYGYHKVKVADPKSWMMKQKYIWEQHYGKVPKGSIVVFIDGNKDNFDIDNLMMLTRSELARANQDGVWSLPVELRRTALLAVRLKVAAKIRNKEAGV